MASERKLLQLESARLSRRALAEGMTPEVAEACEQLAARYLRRGRGRRRACDGDLREVRPAVEIPFGALDVTLLSPAVPWVGAG